VEEKKSAVCCTVLPYKGGKGGESKKPETISPQHVSKKTLNKKKKRDFCYRNGGEGEVKPECSPANPGGIQTFTPTEKKRGLSRFPAGGGKKKKEEKNRASPRTAKGRRK